MQRKIRARNYDHVRTLESELHRIESNNPRILGDSGRVWNMDETSTKVELGKLQIKFTLSNSSKGGHVFSQTDEGKHITVVVTASASGMLAPPFSVADGKKIMKKLDPEIYSYFS